MSFKERRKPENQSYRKIIDEMSVEEMRKELMTDRLTLVGSKRAYEDSEVKDERGGIETYKAFIDVDSLKYINDNLGGHAAGDSLLRVVGAALAHVAPDESYRLGGDEFVLKDQDKESLGQKLQKLEAVLDQVVLTYEHEGRIYEYQGIGVSYGIGKDLATADRGMYRHKQQREEAGLRPDRGRGPLGLVDVTAQGRDIHGQDPQGDSVKPRTLFLASIDCNAQSFFADKEPYELVRIIRELADNVEAFGDRNFVLRGRSGNIVGNANFKQSQPADKNQLTRTLGPTP